MPRVAAPNRSTQPRHAGQRGQAAVFFVLCLVGIVGVAGMLIDGGMASATRRQAQAAADTAALAAAQAMSVGSSGSTAATSIAATNGFTSTITSCSGATAPGVIVNTPPMSGPFVGDVGYVEVTAQRAMHTAFSGLFGQPCWMVSARAVAVVDTSAVSPCTLCSLNNSSKNHTLVLKNSSTLRVDGEIYVDSTNGGTTPGVCTLGQWNVCGDGFDIFGTGGYISAKSIAVVGGWETHNQNIATADVLATNPDGTPCAEHPNPPSQTQTANVCIHMPYLPDPFNDSSRPGNVLATPSPGSRPVAGSNGCPSYATSGTGTSGSPAMLTITGSSSTTICPGTYYGGIKIQGSARVTMQPGVYNIVGGGFQVLGSAGVDGSAGVMIYNGSGAGEAVITNPGTDHVPAAVPGKASPKSPTLTSSNSPSGPGETTTYTFQLQQQGSLGLPTGYVDFYDSDTIVCPGVPLTNVNGSKVQATCTQAYPYWGTHAISAVYNGDGVYNGIGDTFTQTITTPNGTAAGPITLQTNGPVLLTAPSSGAYGGLTLFQERSSNLTITIDPGTNTSNSPVPACIGTFMTASLDGSASWMNGCGSLGGLRGTIYAGDPDALVYINAGGMAYLQVVAGNIEIDSAANARLAYNASYFANGTIHLVE